MECGLGQDCERCPNGLRNDLELVKPREVLISAGKNNKYGHPGKEARARIEHVGADWDCTIWEGRIRVHMDGRKIRVESYKKYRNPSQ